MRRVLALLLLVASATAETDPERLPRKPLYSPLWVDGQIILIGFKEAPKPLAGVTRTREEALALAKRITEEARQKGVRFDDLVEKYSEDPYKRESLGQLGNLPRGLFPVPAVEEALYAMGEGQVSDPIETPCGYVVAMRLAYQTCASHIVVAWEGCRGTKGLIRRSKEEARKRALELRQRVLDGEEFAKVARECSDDASSLFGGHLGFIKRGTMPRAFDSVVFSLAPGEVSEPVETEFGWHVILARGFAESSHVLVGFKEAAMPLPGVTRSRAEALARIEQALARIRAGEDFGKVAREMSDCPSAANDGRLGAFELDKLPFVKEFSDALVKLRQGEVSGVVETPYGFHIIVRWR